MILFALPLLAGCMTPLQKAAYNGQTERVRELLQSEADIDGTAHHKLTPLMWAAGSGQRDAVTLLIEKGANVNAVDPRHRTALWYAAKQGRLPVVKDLVRAGANVFAMDDVGKTPAMAARDGGYVDVFSFLDEADRLAKASGGPSRAELKKTVAEEVQRARQEVLSTKPVRHSDIDKPGYRVPERRSDFALVIGVEKYKTLPDADYATRDAETVRRHLEALGFPRRNIIYLAGSQATRSALASYLEEWLPRNIKADSNVFFYFSGHGAPDVKTGHRYLVPWDGNPGFLKSSAYSIERLHAALESLPVKSVVAAIDACFSGSGGRSVLPKGARPLITQLSSGDQPKGALVVLTAASEHEITATLEEHGHGLFTYYFLKGLSGDAKNGDGVVTPEGLYWYLKPLVQEEARRQNRDQTPLLQGTKTDRAIVRF